MCLHLIGSNMKYIPATILLALIASINLLPPLLGAVVIGTIPLTLTLALGALK